MKSEKWLLCTLMFGTFVIGTSEFVLSGLLSSVAQDLAVSLGHAGGLVTAFAIGYIVSPYFVAVTSQYNKRLLMLCVLSSFLVLQILSSQTQHFSLFLLMRVLGGISAGMFVALSLSLAHEVISSMGKGIIFALIAGGFSVANVLGVPAGTWIGQNFGWRMTFIVLSCFVLVVIWLIFLTIPYKTSRGTSSIKEQFSLLKSSRILMAIGIALLSFAGMFSMFTYLGSYLELGFDLHKELTGPLLFVYGLMTFVSNIVGGKLTSRNVLSRIQFIFMFQLLSLIFLGLGLFIKITPVWAVLFIIPVGLSIFLGTASIQVILVTIADRVNSSAKEFASSLLPSSVNLGIALGSVAGGRIVDILGISFVPWVSSIFIVIAILLAKMLAQSEKSVDQLSSSKKI